MTRRRPPVPSVVRTLARLLAEAEQGADHDTDGQRWDVARVADYEEAARVARDLIAMLERTRDAGRGRAALDGYRLGLHLTRAQLRGLTPELFAGSKVRRGSELGAGKVNAKQSGERDQRKALVLAEFDGQRSRDPAASRGALVTSVARKLGFGRRTVYRYLTGK